MKLYAYILFYIALQINKISKRINKEIKKSDTQTDGKIDDIISIQIPRWHKHRVVKTGNERLAVRSNIL